MMFDYSELEIKELIERIGTTEMYIELLRANNDIERIATQQEEIERIYREINTRY
ncbi:MAG: hypothetical protein ACRC0G_11525 [Fusobacteriaceae bacterium]